MTDTQPASQATEELDPPPSGLEYFADIHIEVEQSLTVAEGHRVKDRLVTEFPSLRDVLVHLEPYPHIHAWEMPFSKADYRPLDLATSRMVGSRV